MIFFVYFAEMFLIDVGVDLGGGNIGVAEHFLDAAQVGAALEQMSAETMAQGVGGYFAGHAGSQSGATYDTPDFNATKRSAGAGDK